MMERAKRYLLLGIVSVCLAFAFPIHALGKEDKSFVTIVNPVRESSYTNNLSDSLRAQYQEVRRYGFPATWLLTFNVLQDSQSLAAVSTFDNLQELGLFLEVTPQLAKAAGVTYHNTGSWHFANSVFLSGYEQEERVKLIDTLFNEFMQTYGYYPKSVGSWWTDSFSLNYMQEKYDVQNNLGCADQFSTDGYQLWGQYWSVPYYPSKSHTAIPASSLQNKIDVVEFQWAARDPLNGYYDSTYSTQDYLTRPKQDTEYFSKLVSLYTSADNNEFGQITVGLESDFDPDTYRGEYRKQLQVIHNLVDSDQVRVTSMATFAEWYRQQFPNLSPAHKIVSKDLLGKDTEMIWYQSPYYRIGYTIDSSTVTIRDLRIYQDTLRDPYWNFPNGETILHINLPALVDEVQDRQAWVLPEGAQIETQPDKLTINGLRKFPSKIAHYPGIRLDYADGASLIFPAKPANPGNVRGWDSESTYFFSSPAFPLRLLQGNGWNLLSRENFSYSQDEVIALQKLATMEYGNVLVRSFHCLQCHWFTEYKTAAFANLRGYVGRVGKKKVVYAPTLLEPASREEAQALLKKTSASYIYLVKYGDYLEYLPFSPGDWGIELVFENANAQIWKVIPKK